MPQFPLHPGASHPNGAGVAARPEKFNQALCTQLDRIDWRRPWLAPLADQGRAVALDIAAGQSVAESLNRQAGSLLSVAFVAADEPGSALPYEAQVFSTRLVPTRDNLHDFFNGLCWTAFPQTKLRLNQLHAAQLAAQLAENGSVVRGPVRDALTLFDENAALLQAPEALWQALAARQWQRLFGELRPLWRHARLTLFGHALLEKLVQPYKSITAHVWRVDTEIEDLPDLDAWLALDLTPEKLARKPFAALPVLGVPAWWSANEDPAFYADASVFRSAAQTRRGHVPTSATT